jgi:hypothetical protein
MALSNTDKSANAFQAWPPSRWIVNSRCDGWPYGNSPWMAAHRAIGAKCRHAYISGEIPARSSSAMASPTARSWVIIQIGTPLERKLRQLALRMSSSCSSGTSRDWSLGRLPSRDCSKVNATTPSMKTLTWVGESANNEAAVAVNVGTEYCGETYVLLNCPKEVRYSLQSGLAEIVIETPVQGYVLIETLFWWQQDVVGADTL